MRQPLNDILEATPENWGLAFDRYYPGETGNPNEKGKPNLEALHDRLCAAPLPAAYSAAYRAWEALNRGRTRTYRTSGPLAVGLGVASPFEIGMSFMRTYGVPYIPGTSIKGAMAREAIRQLDLIDVFRDTGADKKAETRARDWLDENGQVLPEHQESWNRLMQFAALFGDTEGQGVLEVFDAWLVPIANPLMADVITNHHRQYYASQDPNVWPTDDEDPLPNAFLSVKPGTDFLFALRAPEGWLMPAWDLLEVVLTKHGIGAKTNAGYGRMKRPPAPPGRDARVRSVQGNNITVEVGNSSGLLLDPPTDPPLQRGDRIRVTEAGRQFRYLGPADP